MKILIIPDVHGRDFWMEPCNHIDEFDKVVFLGDYHDPYLHQVDQGTSLKRLEEKLVPFVEEHKDKVVCLFGNHDGNYLVGDMTNRMDYFNRMKVTHLLERMNLQLIYTVDGYLFSHAGVLPAWMENHELKLEDLYKLPFKDPSLLDVSPYRGGWNKCGSCVWGDVREYNASYHYKGYYQIFGHTQLQGPVIDKDYACLDCRQAFVLDTETKELKQWESTITS